MVQGTSHSPKNGLKIRCRFVPPRFGTWYLFGCKVSDSIKLSTAATNLAPRHNRKQVHPMDWVNLVLLVVKLSSARRWKKRGRVFWVRLVGIVPNAWHGLPETKIFCKLRMGKFPQKGLDGFSNVDPTITGYTMSSQKTYTQHPQGSAVFFALAHFRLTIVDQKVENPEWLGKTWSQDGFKHLPSWLRISLPLLPGSNGCPVGRKLGWINGERLGSMGWL